ncbi:MAG: hypothetical protein JNL65_04795 [Saprospiraceae bacterium]|nr:hypothetical protein [Saprospiraceae bacterium]
MTKFYFLILLFSLISCSKSTDGISSLDCGLDELTCFEFIVEGEEIFGFAGGSATAEDDSVSGSSAGATLDSDIYEIDFGLLLVQGKNQYENIGFTLHRNQIELNIIKSLLKVEKFTENKIFRANFEFDAYDDVANKTYKIRRGIIHTRIFN